MPSANLNTYASRPRAMYPGKDKLFGIDLKGIFPGGGLTGTPSVTCVLAVQSYPATQVPTPGAVSTSDPTFGAPIVNTGTFTSDEGRTVQPGEGVQVQVHGTNVVDGGNYTLLVSASDGTSTEALLCVIQVRGTAQPAPY